MRYRNLKFGYNKASVKSTALQNCTGKKNTPWRTEPQQNLMEHKLCLAIYIVSKTHLKLSNGKVCIF